MDEIDENYRKMQEKLRNSDFKVDEVIEVMSQKLMRDYE